VIEIHELYFKWLMERLGNPEPSVVRLCSMLDQNVFQRRVGKDMNRAADGANLRKLFLEDYSDADIDPRVANALLDEECSWLEMLVALAEALDYLYDGGVLERFIELAENLGLEPVLQTVVGRDGTSPYDDVDQHLVDICTSRVDHNEFDRLGHGGLFPLTKNDHPDQREVEIWDQHAAYFRERLEGVMWTSTN
jgi:hypothetical protein